MSFDTNSKKITVGIFAHPVSHSASPAMHNRAFKKLGLNYTYEAFDVPPDKLTDAIQDIRNRNLRGVNLTIPHKEKVLPFLDEISEDAKNIGAVNTILHDE
ncbi:shikimate dehydrogenase, partial [PVC group bacterium]|nr:shikimate dehydrogenase [PVC group bacterium]